MAGQLVVPVLFATFGQARDCQTANRVQFNREENQALPKDKQGKRQGLSAEFKATWAHRVNIRKVKADVR
jgi:hypothetical protein